MSTELIAPPQEKIRFMSRSPNQVLTRRKTRYVTNELGERVVMTEDEWQERQGELNEQRVMNGQPEVDFDRAPWKIEFDKAVFETEDPVLVEYLRTHKNFNFNGPGGFWEVQPPIDEREPTVKEQLREVQQASLYRDLERAEVCLQVEEETHNRPVVLEAAAQAIASIKELDADGVPDADSKEAPPSTPQP